MQTHSHKSVQNLSNFSKFGSNLAKSIDIARFCLEFSSTRKVSNMLIVELKLISIDE